jgi:DNA polymerase I-like protein with 3'-5' exonuclease and polymerase domains
VDSEKDPEVDLFLGISVGFGVTGMYFPFNHMEEDVNIDDETHDLLWQVLASTPLRVIHNAAYDLNEFAKLGYDFWHLPFACTMIMAHMVDENVPNKGLDYLSKLYCGNSGKQRPELMQSFIDSFGWRYVPVQLMDEYASEDAVLHWQL